MRVTVALLAALLAGCSSVETLKASEEQAAAMGNATPVSSPDGAKPDGKVSEIAANKIAIAGKTLAIVDDSTLRIGSLDDIVAGKAKSLNLKGECGEPTASGASFVLACGTDVFLIDAADPSLDKKLTGERPFSSAVLTSTGEVIAGGTDRGDLTIFGDNKQHTVAVGQRTDQLVITPTDSVAAINREQTAIQGVLWKDRTHGAALRVGVGVGKVAPGDGDVVFATDTSGDQLAVYTLDPVIRLHQTAPVADSPWGLAWDKGNNVVWVASTGTNTITAYSINTGVPEEKGTLKTIANARAVAIDADGNLLVGSDSELQVLDADTLTNALS